MNGGMKENTDDRFLRTFLHDGVCHKSALNSSTVKPACRMMARRVPFATSGWSGHSESPVRGKPVPKHDVAAALMVELVSDCSQRSGDLAARNAGEVAHSLTSTTSSVIGGGTGSL